MSLRLLATFLLLMLALPAKAQDETGEGAERPGAPGEGAVAGAEDGDADDPLPLPEWTPEDRSRLIRGLLVPGQALLGMEDLPEDLRNVPAAEDFEIDPDEEGYDPTRIPPELLSRYRVPNPESFLLDPQHLLTMQERLDQEYFLDLQSKESPVRIQLVLFDREQIVPTEINLRSLLQRSFKRSEWTVVVQYHLGNPKRTQLAFTPDLAQVVDENKRLSMLRESVSGAIRQSDPESQLQSFLIGLSNEIYWLEGKVRKVRRQQRSSESGNQGSAEARSADSPAAMAPGPAAAEPPAASSFKLGEWLNRLGQIAIWTGLGILATGSIVFLWILFLKLKRYRFPELGYEDRLGGSHGAAVGPVLKFKNPNLSPTSQRSEAMPDYLTRI